MQTVKIVFYLHFAHSYTVCVKSKMAQIGTCMYLVREYNLYHHINHPACMVVQECTIKRSHNMLCKTHLNPGLLLGDAMLERWPFVELMY